MADLSAAESVFAQALDCASPEERSLLLDRACAGSDSLRREVESLFAAHEQAGDDFMAEASGPAPAARAETPPVIPGFRIERALGRGGLGVVWEAWDEKLRRKVAIKTLFPSRESRQRMLDEARKMAALRDPAIVTIHAVLDESEPRGLVMELVEGAPVDQYAGSLTFGQKASILREIARGLAAAHERGIVHRDLKPANVLVTPALKPVLLDFGLALSEKEWASAAGRFEGTPLYASPEQAAGQPVSAASDVFSLGSLMFKLLTGKDAFSGAGVAQVLQAIQTAEPPFPRDLAAGIPADLQAICLACLAKDPAARPSASAVALDLGRFLAGEPARLRPALYGDILRRRISEHANDLVNWAHQGMISADEKDRLDLVQRRILADEDHWLVDARRLTLAQSLLYTSAWMVVVAAGLLVWLARADLSPAQRWMLPLLAVVTLAGAGWWAERRKERLASAAFLAGAALAVVPATLALLAELRWLARPAPGVTQLFGETFANQQVLAASAAGLGLSILGLCRLRLTGFAWTTCALGAAAYVSLLLQWNWLGQKLEVQALWLLPLTAFSALALWFEKAGRVRWAAPFYLAALAVLIGALDGMALAGPGLEMLGIGPSVSPYFNPARQQHLSLALNGLLFLGLMIGMERARSLDLRRASRVFEVAALIHLLGGLYQNAQSQREDPQVMTDVGLYLGAVLLTLILGPWRARWRMLLGALGGVALGSYLLLDLNLVPKKAFVLGLGALGVMSALSACAYLIAAPRRRKE